MGRSVQNLNSFSAGAPAGPQTPVPGSAKPGMNSSGMAGIPRGPQPMPVSAPGRQIPMRGVVQSPAQSNIAAAVMALRGGR